MPRKKSPPIDVSTARLIGGLLRGLRKSAGYRAVADAAGADPCPAAQQTIYAYERGGLVPSFRQFMQLVEFYALKTPDAPPEVRPLGVAAVVQALCSPAYGFPQAYALIAMLQPEPPRTRARKNT